LHVTPNWNDTIYCYELLREGYNDEIVYFSDTSQELYETIHGKKYDFIFFELDQVIFYDLNTYSLKLLEILKIILKCQKPNGTVIIKIDNIFYKPVIDIIYILTSLYNKTSIVKPNTSNISSFEKYIICKNFTVNYSKNEVHKKYYYDLLEFINGYRYSNNLNIQSIIEQEIPYHFINKIDDINIINGHQQLESINQIINVLKNKNREDKIESMKKTNIQKSVNWCEKFKIPCNKFSDKINIFLPIAKEITGLNENIITPQDISEIIFT
jgi:tRNA nucleotidyltransferase/poly(A) polymerase